MITGQILKIITFLFTEATKEVQEKEPISSMTSMLTDGRVITSTPFLSIDGECEAKGHSGAHPYHSRAA